MCKPWSLLTLALLTACASRKDDTACADDGVYRDGDGDRYIDEHEFDGCDSVPAELIDRLGDCDDADRDIHPTAEDVPGDGIDQDCDGEDAVATGTGDTGEDTDAKDTGGGDSGAEDTAGDEPADSDHDGAPDDGDCEPYDDDAFPGAVETCDGTDNDCDGDIDDEAADASTWYADADGDGYGDPEVSVVACDAPTGYVANNTDSNDLNSSEYPGSTATDDDDDGYSDDAGDCDDGSSAVSPGAVEIPYDGIDQDCSGADLTDVDGDGDDAIAAGGDDPDDTDASIYAGSDDDVDGDGFTPADADCDDSDSSTFPGAPELCDGLDHDCDGVPTSTAYTLYYPDVDGDTYGDASGAVLSCGDLDGYVDDSTDCDDADAAINPGAREICNDVDDDCDGLVDDADVVATADLSLWYSPDLDADGYTDSSDPDFAYTWACEAPAGYASATGDCADDNPLVYPDAPEVCDDARNDCNQSSAFWAANADTLEAGIVSYIANDGALIKDYTADIPTSSGSPVTVTLDEDGALNFCADPAGTTWYVAIEADNVSVNIAGLRGSALTELSGDGVARPIAVTNTTADVSGFTLSDGYASAGGALYASYASLNLSDVVLQDSEGTGVNQNDAALTLVISEASLTDVTIAGSLSSYGLGCYVSTVSATGLTVEDNEHTGVYLYQCDSTFTAAEITNNVEQGLYIQSYGTTNITDSTIDHNNRGIYALHAGTLTIEDSYIGSNGYATSGGGGIYVYYTGSVTLTDTTLESNHAVAGGAIYLNYAAELSMSGTTGCTVAADIDAYANAAYFAPSWAGTLTSSGCTWEEGQDIYLGLTNTTVDTSALSDPLDFTCTIDGCI